MVYTKMTISRQKHKNPIYKKKKIGTGPETLGKHVELQMHRCIW